MKVPRSQAPGLKLPLHPPNSCLRILTVEKNLAGSPPVLTGSGGMWGWWTYQKLRRKLWKRSCRPWYLLVATCLVWMLYVTHAQRLLLPSIKWGGSGGQGIKGPSSAYPMGLLFARLAGWLPSPPSAPSSPPQPSEEMPEQQFLQIYAISLIICKPCKEHFNVYIFRLRETQFTIKEILDETDILKIKQFDWKRGQIHKSCPAAVNKI